jgi:hypothetical protein
MRRVKIPDDDMRGSPRPVEKIHTGICRDTEVKLFLFHHTAGKIVVDAASGYNNYVFHR